MFNNQKCKKITLILFLLAAFNSLWAQKNNIDYLGIFSTEIDLNMAKMTSDLYFTQLSEIQDINIFDKRQSSIMESEPDIKNLSQSNLSFYTKIKKSETSETWIATFYVIDPAKNETHSKQIEYDSFYKILMESKTTLKDSLEKLLNNTPEEQETDLFSASMNTSKIITSTDNISGTWSGEEYIDKIVILRGGRGFIIFQNGASMTISVSISDSEVIIKQKGRSNASFYPYLPRAVALVAALEADPLEWKFKFINNNTLSGSKISIKANGDSFEYNTENVQWNRID